jgi:hypothetical protein
MSCVTCGGEGSVRRDAAVYCTSCATRRDWGSLLEVVQNPRGTNSPIVFDVPEDEAVSPVVPLSELVGVPVSDGPAGTPAPVRLPVQPAVEEASPFAVLNGEAKPWDASTAETLVDESMLKAIDELTKTLEVLPSAEDIRAQYAADESDIAERHGIDPALARVSHVGSSVDDPATTPRYAAAEPVPASASGPGSHDGHKADPFG